MQKETEISLTEVTKYKKSPYPLMRVKYVILKEVCKWGLRLTTNVFYLEKKKKRNNIYFTRRSIHNISKILQPRGRCF